MISSPRRSSTPWWPGASFWNMRGSSASILTARRRNGWKNRVARDLDLVLEIDVQGAAQVKEKLPESVAIFILPPSREELERRLRSRGQDADEEIARRLAKARDEIVASEKFYDFCVVNDDVERAGREAQAIVMALRCSQRPAPRSR